MPDGFHETTAAYRHFVAANDLRDRIFPALRAVDPARRASLEATARGIADIFACAELGWLSSPAL